MAIYIPSGVQEATGALANWVDLQNRTTTNNMNNALKQLQALQQSDASMEDIAKVQQIINMGGSSLAPLFTRPVRKDEMEVYSTQTLGRQTTPQDYAKTQEGLDILTGIDAKKKEIDAMKAGIGQEKQQALAAEAKLKEENWVTNQEDFLQRVENVRKLLGPNATTQEAVDLINNKKDAQAKALDIYSTGGDIANKLKMEVSIAGDLKKSLTKKFGDTTYTRNLTQKADAGQYAVTPENNLMMQKLEAEDIAYRKPAETEKKIESTSKALIKDEEGFKQKTIEFANDQMQKIKQDYENGILDGNETSAKAKATRVFNDAMDIAVGTRNVNEARKVYNNYITDMKNIDAKYNKKSYYNPFNKEYADLIYGQRPQRGRIGGAGVTYDKVTLFDDNLNKYVTVNLGATSLEDAYKKAAEKGYSVETGHLIGINPKTLNADPSDDKTLKDNVREYKANLIKLKEDGEKFKAKNRERLTFGVDNDYHTLFQEKAGVKLKGDYDIPAMAAILAKTPPEKIVTVYKMLGKLDDMNSKRPDWTPTKALAAYEMRGFDGMAAYTGVGKRNSKKPASPSDTAGGN